jgi:hypothetical protein
VQPPHSAAEQTTLTHKHSTTQQHWTEYDKVKVSEAVYTSNK